MPAFARVAIAAAFTLIPTLAAAASPGPSASPSEHDRAYQVGLRAYTYGLPLLTTDATFQTMTSVPTSEGPYGPVNQFHHVRGENTSSSTAVVAPSATSLSSIAWLDLSAEPQVLTVPGITGHAWMLALLDPWTENVAMLSSAVGTTAGSYLVAGPGQEAAALPAGAQRIDVDATRIWIIGSTQLLGPDDLPAVHAIQDGYTLTPLSRYAASGVAPSPSPAASPVAVPVTPHAVPTGLAFLDELGHLLVAFPPPAADAPELAALRTVGIGPGLTPSTDPTLDPETLRGLADAIADGPAAVQADLALIVRDAPASRAGWLLGGFGRYGTDYVTRAVIADVGLGAVIPEQAIYAMTWSDAAGEELNGSGTYTLHLATPPPTSEGWSLTVYDLKGALVANSLGRDAFTHRSPLTRNADGSVDILLSATPPTDAAQLANWLPTPAGEGFEVAWRLFATDTSAIPAILDGSGWQPPAITPAG